jgi:hypothetical protein
MEPRENLKHKLMIVGGLPAGHPDDAELDKIIKEIEAIRKERTPTEADWKTSAGRNVRGAGEYKYAGEDMSDLNSLLMQILNTQTPGIKGMKTK